MRRTEWLHARAIDDKEVFRKGGAFRFIYLTDTVPTRNTQVPSGGFYSYSYTVPTTFQRPQLVVVKQLHCDSSGGFGRRDAVDDARRCGSCARPAQLHDVVLREGRGIRSV